MLLLVTGCRMIPNPDIIVQDNARWLDRPVKTIAISDILVSEELRLHPQFKQDLERGILAILKDKGFEALASSRFQTIYAQKQREFGGFFDPVTGQKDIKKFNAFNASVVATLVSETDAQLLVSFEVFKTFARYSGNVATWDNATDNTIHPPNILFDSSNGTTPAISIKISVFDIQNQKTYSKIQGLQTIVDNGTGWHIHPDDLNIHLITLSKTLNVLENQATNDVQ
ncbi:hypothetical protein LJ739_11300 [Aestuariibacter halophilus]|uniref:Uncharacterized protein n=2 Tax=Fluctibacter halophilus TaxID=226011 RepID=A0ABS8G8I4_9ALTE|nr:hypothetical protein [Aestuariibacter halophilus]